MNDLIVIDTFFVDGREMKLTPPLVLSVKVEDTPASSPEEDRLFVVEDSELNIYAFTDRREQLPSEIKEQLAHLWLSYAESSEPMTPDAAELAQTLRSRIKGGN